MLGSNVRFAGLALSVIALLAAVAPPAQAAPNGLDSSFGDQGKVIADYGPSDSARAVAVQPDGKILVAGEIQVFDLDIIVHKVFALVRYNRDGSVDRSFGDNGKVTTDFAGGCEGDEAHLGECGTAIPLAIALQPDGRIVVAGHTVVAAFGPLSADVNRDFAVARYNADGTPDTTFGGDGKATNDLGGQPNPTTVSLDGATSVGVDADGRIVAAGYRDTVGEAGLALVRYKPDGTLDASFDGDGVVWSTDGAFANALALQADGAIVVAGLMPVDGSTDFGLWRYTAAGARDHTFGDGGQATTDFSDGHFDGATAVAIQPDGRIVAAGGTSATGGGDFALARYHADGTLDTALGGDGKVTTNFLGGDTAQAVVIQPDGGIVAGGSTGVRVTGAGGFALARYRADGTLAASGGDDGKTVDDFGLEHRPALGDMALQPDGKIVAAGFIAPIPCTCIPSDFVVARYKRAGSWRVDAPGHREVHPCVNDSLVDFNSVFGVPEQFACGATINPGEPWRPFASWFVGDQHYAVPPGYVPSADAPLDDLVGKLEAVKVRVDAGTKQESTAVFTPAEALRTDVTIDQLDPEVPPFPMASTLPRMKPLSVGRHTVEVIWVLSGMHCDGLGTSVAGNCLAAGDVSMGRHPLSVTRP